ncbi:MAG: hypothetical protein ACRCWR_09680 [Saezia sp.]
MIAVFILIGIVVFFGCEALRVFGLPPDKIVRLLCDELFEELQAVAQALLSPQGGNFPAEQVREAVFKYGPNYPMEDEDAFIDEIMKAIRQDQNQSK